MLTGDAAHVSFQTTCAKSNEGNVESGQRRFSRKRGPARGLLRMDQVPRTLLRAASG